MARSGRRGTPDSVRRGWQATYERARYTQLPWYEPGPSPQVRDAVRDRFWRKGGRILDIGCGAGSNVLFLARSGYAAHGIDLSSGAIAAASARAERAGLTVDVREGDALALAFGSGRLDGASDNGCFHTIPIRRRPDYVAELARVLRPGAGFLLAWVAREYTKSLGPPHRPSVGEIAEAFEASFQFVSVRFRPGSSRVGLPAYEARFVRRTRAQPPVR